MGLELFSLEGRTALVIGGKRGLGYAMAEAFAQAGADVALVSREAGRLEEAAGRLAAATGRRVLALAGDATQPQEVRRIVDETLAVFGRIDILVNSAGINIRKPVEQMSLDEWNQVMDTNLTATFLACQAVGPHMKKAGFGRVINVASILANFGLADRTAYCSSKGGVLQLTRVLALEWAKDGVTVNAICPGFFATELNTPVLQDKEAYARLCAKIPVGRFGDPEEIKAAALFLASPAANYVTGAAIYVDGGVTAEV